MLERLLPSNFYPGLTRLEALGIYGQCYKLSIFMTLVIQAFRLGAEPFFFKKSQDDDAAQTYAQVMDWFVLACCGILLAVSILLPWIAPYFLRRPEYFQGLGVVPILLLANIFLGVYYNLSVWFKVSDKPQMGTYITVGGAVFTILLNLILIPTIGYMGSAITTLGCYAGMAAACYLLGRKSYPVPYRIAPLLFLVTICGIGVAIMQMTSDQKLWFLLATALPLIWLWNAWQLYSRDRAEA